MKSTLPKHVRLHRASGRFRAVVAVDGERVYGPLRDDASDAATDAQEMVRARRRQTGRIVTIRECFDVLLAELRDGNARPDTVGYYRKYWRVVTKPGGWHPETPAREVAADQVQRYVRRRVDVGGVSLSTAWDKEVGALRRVLLAAVRAGALRDDPLTGLRRPKIRQGRFDMLPTATIRDAIEKIRAWPRARNPERDALMIELFATTGMRRAEVARLTVGDCDLATGRIYVDGKTADRYLPMTDDLRRIVSALAGDGPSDAQLIGSPDKIERIFDRWRKRLDLPKLSPHVLRHSFATAAVAAGVDPFRLATLLGHRDIRQTQRYYHASDSAQREALASVMRLHGL